jgi:predicted ATPase
MILDKPTTMPALDWISIKGFKSIRSIDKLQLQDINVIIGANGSGKSNFINAFAFLHAIREGRLQAYVKRAGGAERLLHFGSKETEQMSFELSFRSDTNRYGVVLTSTADDSLSVLSESASWSGPNVTYTPSVASGGDEAGISKPTDKKILLHVQQHLDRWRLYHFHDVGSASPMKKNAVVNDNRYLRQDGANLAAFLYLLRENYPGAYARIRSVVAMVAPYFDDFVLEPLSLDSEFIRLEWRHKGSDAYFDASSFSDGTIRFIALATLLLQPDETRPSIIIVDEPELGLHPFAIQTLAALVRSVSKQSQVILSTQSALLLDEFEPAQVLVADRNDGATGLSRLDPAILSGWLEEYSLGELWNKNEFGGRPSREAA